LIVREYTEADLETFKRIHAQSGLDYQMPDLSSPLFIVKTVIERAGKPTTLLAARIEAETYLLSDGAPADKWEDIQMAQPIFLNALWEKGIDNTYCCVPPAVDFHFGKRMKSLGWEQIRDWRPYYRETVL
jgi:hypothetical protein